LEACANGLPSGDYTPDRQPDTCSVNKLILLFFPTDFQPAGSMFRVTSGCYTPPHTVLANNTAGLVALLLMSVKKLWFDFGEAEVFFEFEPNDGCRPTKGVRGYVCAR
jgi:hypothetical protein